VVSLPVRFWALVVEFNDFKRGMMLDMCVIPQAKMNLAAKAVTTSRNPGPSTSS
jgi:hypothetical protein